MGSVLYGQVEWNVDAELVVRYRRAGLIPFGRSTSAELGLSPTSESPVYGAPTQNPWKPGHSAGGPARAPRWPAAWCTSRTAATAAVRSAFPRPAAACWA